MLTEAQASQTWEIAVQAEKHHTDPIAVAQPERHLRWPAVQPLVGVSKATWWRMVRQGTAPKGVRVSANCVAWPESNIAAFLADRAERSKVAA